MLLGLRVLRKGGGQGAYCFAVRTFRHHSFSPSSFSLLLRVPLLSRVPLRSVASQQCLALRPDKKLLKLTGLPEVKPCSKLPGGIGSFGTLTKQKL